MAGLLAVSPPRRNTLRPSPVQPATIHPLSGCGTWRSPPGLSASMSRRSTEIHHRAEFLTTLCSNHLCVKCVRRKGRSSGRDLARRARRRMTSRRAILIGATSLVMSGRASAQQRIFRMGYLSPLSVAAGAPTWSAFFNRLEELGYRAERNLVVDYRVADGRLDLLPGLAAELVGLKPDILFAV